MTDQPLTLVGVDGGGTSTRAVRVSLEGHVVALARGGPSNPTSTSLEETVESLRTVFRALAENLEPGPVAVCLGLAGVGFSGRREPVKALTKTLLKEDGWVPLHVRVVTDAEAALEAATEGGPGSVLIAGTGSVALGRNSRGETARAGGWGLTLGDEGSGAWLGRELFRQIAREHDGREPDTGLGPAVIRALGLSDAQALVPLVYGPPALRAIDFAGYAGVVLDLAQSGAPGAIALVERAASELVLAAEALWTTLSLPREAPLGLTGGILGGESPVAKAVSRLLGVRLGVLPHHLTLPPAVGAVLAAAREATNEGTLHLLAESPDVRAVTFS